MAMTPLDIPTLIELYVMYDRQTVKGDSQSDGAYSGRIRGAYQDGRELGDADGKWPHDYNARYGAVNFVCGAGVWR
jgi:hypothetical protein